MIIAFVLLLSTIDNKITSTLQMTKRTNKKIKNNIYYNKARIPEKTFWFFQLAFDKPHSLLAKKLLFFPSILLLNKNLVLT